jgi:hypothetical protein
MLVAANAIAWKYAPAARCQLGSGRACQGNLPATAWAGYSLIGTSSVGFG